MSGEKNRIPNLHVPNREMGASLRLYTPEHWHFKLQRSCTPMTHTMQFQFSEKFYWLKMESVQMRGKQLTG
jgi:hypothetical protein